MNNSRKFLWQFTPKQDMDGILTLENKVIPTANKEEALMRILMTVMGTWFQHRETGSNLRMCVTGLKPKTITLRTDDKVLVSVKSFTEFGMILTDAFTSGSSDVSVVATLTRGIL